MSKSSLFITFEGIDFSGKTTQIEALIKAFEARHRHVLFVREPGGTSISESIRQILLDKDNTGMSNRSELLLYAAARAQIVDEKIKPALEDNQVVICDRFIDSMTAYQGYGRGLDLNFINKLNAFATGGLKPDLTFFLDIAPHLAEERRAMADRTADRLDTETQFFFDQVRKGYLDLVRSEPSRFTLIDGALEKTKIQQLIWHRIQPDV